MIGAMQTNYKAFSSGRSSNLKKKNKLIHSVQNNSPLNTSQSAFYKKNGENNTAGPKVAIGIPPTLLDKG